MASIGSGLANSRNGRTGDKRVLLDERGMATRTLPHPMRRHGRRRIFRNVRVLRHDPRHAAQAEARAEPIDQMGEIFGVIVAAKSRLRRIGALGDQRREPHRVVAEAGIADVAENGKPLLE